MKKFIFIVGLISLLTTNSVMAHDSIDVYMDGEKMFFDPPAQVINGSTIVPMRQVFEKLGATVDWNANTKSILAKKQDSTIELTIDNNVMNVDNKSINLNVAPTLINGFTYVPLRAVSETFGAKINWSQKNNFVTISLNKPVSYADFYNIPDIGDTFKLSATNIYSPTEYSCTYDYAFDDEQIDFVLSDENITAFGNAITSYGYINISDGTETEQVPSPLKFQNPQDPSYFIRLTPFTEDKDGNNVMRVEIEKNIRVYKEDFQNSISGTPLSNGWISLYIPMSALSRYKDEGWAEQPPYINKTIWIHKSAIPAFTGVKYSVNVPAYVPVVVTGVAEDETIPDNIFYKKIKKLQIDCNGNSYSCDINLFVSGLNIYTALGYGAKDAISTSLNSVLYNTPIQIDESPESYFKLTDSELNAMQLGVVYKGISEKMFLIIKGTPDTVNESSTNESVYKQYVYRGKYSTDYYYFLDGIMVSESSIK